MPLGKVSFVKSLHKQVTRSKLKLEKPYACLVEDERIFLGIVSLKIVYYLMLLFRVRFSKGFSFHVLCFHYKVIPSQMKKITSQD